MFSSRLDWDLRPNALSRLLDARRASGTRVYDLTESNPTAAGFDYPPEVTSALSDPGSLVYEPSAAGLEAAREAVASHYAGQGLAAPAGRILLAASTSEAYGWLFKLLCDPGDEILVPRPSYPLFDYLAALESVRVNRYPLVYDHGWTLDLESLEAGLTPRTRAIVVVNPNNPTGSFLKTRDRDRLLELCAGRKLALISDEVFHQYQFASDADRVVSLCGQGEALAFSLGGLSKSAGLPQMKLAWVLVSGPEDLCRRAWERLELVADTYLSPGTPVQRACGALLAAGALVRSQIQARTLANLAHLRAALAPSSPFRVLEVEGGWYAILEVPRIRTEEEWALLLLGEDHVLVQPGYFYDFEREGFLVLSLLPRPGDFQEGVRRILKRA